MNTDSMTALARHIEAISNQIDRLKNIGDHHTLQMLVGDLGVLYDKAEYAHAEACRDPNLEVFDEQDMNVITPLNELFDRADRIFERNSHLYS